MDNDLQSIQEARELTRKAKTAQKILSRYSQEEVDRLVALMAEAGYRASRELAELACLESGLGRVESKIQKNQFATRNVYEYIKNMKTVGVVHQDENKGIWEIATPMGVVVGIIPITNPTSTAMFKILIAIKARCAIVLSPHPRGIKCIGRSAEVMRKAIDSIGAPTDLISCLSLSTLAATHELMKDSSTDVVLATGGSGLVKAAYSSGKPAIGVGPGNCPAFIERSADISHAIRCLVVSQGFDWGTICASEQSVILDSPIAQKCLTEFQNQKAHICSDIEISQLEALMPPGAAINPDLVGQSPYKIAQIAGFTVPSDTTILIARQKGVGDKFKLSREKLAPILSLYIEDGWEAGCHRSFEILRYGGMGHTLTLHSRNQKVISRFALEKPAYRILINSPSSQGAVGYASKLPASMTLGCGSSGGNITSDNITPRHLLNIKRIAYGKQNWFSDMSAPMKPKASLPEKNMSYQRDPFQDEAIQGRGYYVGPHNNPHI